MPLYFFEVTGPSPFASSCGVELADEDAAWSLAVTSTGELLRDLDGKMPDRAEIVAIVRDEHGGKIITLRVIGEKGEPGDQSMQRSDEPSR